MEFLLQLLHFSCWLTKTDRILSDSPSRCKDRFICFANVFAFVSLRESIRVRREKSQCIHFWSVSVGHTRIESYRIESNRIDCGFNWCASSFREFVSCKCVKVCQDFVFSFWMKKWRKENGMLIFAGRGWLISLLCDWKLTWFRKLSCCWFRGSVITVRKAGHRTQCRT